MIHSVFVLIGAGLHGRKRSMELPVVVKVCGLTRQEDVDFALNLGADFLGFILCPESPRGLSLKDATELLAHVPTEKRVAVDIEPTLDALKRYRDAGFHAFQVHERGSVDLSLLASWSELVGKDRLWFAPRLKSAGNFPKQALKYADTILIDSYTVSQVGGTGKTGDWQGFRDLQKEYAAHRFILAGGLNPDNIADALAISGACHVDVNSGVESQPGVKDALRLKAFFHAIGR